MARPARLERATPSSGGWCSIQLSYGRGRKTSYHTALWRVDFLDRCTGTDWAVRPVALDRSPGSDDPNENPGNGTGCLAASGGVAGPEGVLDFGE